MEGHICLDAGTTAALRQLAGEGRQQEAAPLTEDYLVVLQWPRTSRLHLLKWYFRHIDHIQALTCTHTNVQI